MVSLKVVGICMLYFCTEFHVLSFSSLLVIVIRWKAKYRFCVTAILLFRLPTKVDFFRTLLLPHKISSMLSFLKICQLFQKLL